MPISPQAYKLCGERKKDGELLVFAGLPDPHGYLGLWNGG